MLLHPKHLASGGRPEDALEEARKGTAARGADRRDRDHQIVGKAIAVCVDGRVGVPRMSVRHEDLRVPVQGQLLRRRGERRARREMLQSALTIFTQIGAPLWVEKTRAEIAPIGGRGAPDELTEGEERVAELTAQGRTNPEIAARLFSQETG